MTEDNSRKYDNNRFDMFNAMWMYLTLTSARRATFLLSLKYQVWTEGEIQIAYQSFDKFWYYICY